MNLLKPLHVPICLLLATLIAGSAVARAERRSVRLNVGQSTVISVPKTITKVQVLGPEVADVASYSKRSVTIVGVDGGSTELLVTTARETYKYTITVTRVEVGRLYKQVRDFLGRVEGIYPRLVGETVVIGGAALTPDDYGRAQRAAEIFGDRVLNLVQFRPSAIEQINQILQRGGLNDVRARLVGGTLFLEGAVGSAAEMEKLKAILRAYGLQAENLVRVGGDRQILIDVQFIEMTKTGLDRIGVEWPARLGASSAGSLRASIPLKPSGGSQIAIDLEAPILQTTAAVNLLFSTGKARLLAQPKLVCGSGQSAEFLVGGEVPVAVVTNNVASVQYKDFGVKLLISPTADSLGNIQAAIHAEVSEVDTSVQIQSLPGLPGFTTRRFKTFVTVKEGSSIVLSGLFRNIQQKNVSKLPLLGNLPILGELFKSRQFRDEKTTLVVFVTPRIVSPRHPWVIDTIREMQRLYREYESEVGWQVFD